jgi:hypothetical protein
MAATQKVTREISAYGLLVQMNGQGMWFPMAYPASVSFQEVIDAAGYYRTQGHLAKVTVDGKVVVITGGHPTFDQYSSTDDDSTPCACWRAGNADWDGESYPQQITDHPHGEEFAEGWKAAFEKANDI